MYLQTNTNSFQNLNCTLNFIVIKDNYFECPKSSLNYTCEFAKKPSKYINILSKIIIPPLSTVFYKTAYDIIMIIVHNKSNFQL